MECRAQIRGFCKSHARAEAHRRVREFVRERDEERCVFAKEHRAMFPCSSTWQPNHVFVRGNLRCAWAEWNVVGGCSSLNTWAHYHQHEWENMNRERWGVAKFDRLWAISVNGPTMDVGEVLATYSKYAK
jgi:hypothetical protein